VAKILVTGGLGFIGSNLVKELRVRGHDVWLCDLTHSQDPKSIRCDVSKYRQVERLFEQQDFEYVYHLAAEYGRWNGEDYYENLWLTNVVGTKNIIRMQEKMIFFSSAEFFITRVERPDSSKVKRDLNFKITVEPEVGIPKAIEWFREVYRK